MSSLARQLERKRIDKAPDHQRQVNQETSPRRRITSGERLLYFVTLIGLVLATYLVISNYAAIYIANNEIYSLQKSINTQTISNEALQLQVTELSAPERILEIATEELGMTLDDKNVKVVKN